MDRLQSNNKEHMNEEYALNLEEDEETLHLEEDEEAEDTLHLEEEDEEDMMIQDDYEEQSQSLSDVLDTKTVDTRELMCITLTLKEIPAHLR